MENATVSQSLNVSLAGPLPELKTFAWEMENLWLIHFRYLIPENCTDSVDPVFPCFDILFKKCKTVLARKLLHEPPPWTPQ